MPTAVRKKKTKKVTKKIVKKAANNKAVKTKINVEVVGITELKEHPRNYRDHPDDQLDHIIQSIKANGVYRNVVISKDNTILAGHGVVKALKKLKKKDVPVIRLNIKPDSPQALKILTGDNEIGHLGLIDDRVLTEILKEVNEVDAEGLLGTGFDEMMLANLAMVTRTRNEIKDINEAAEWLGMPEFDQGVKVTQLNVQFKEQEAFEEFLDKMGLKDAKMTKFAEGKRYTMWWPPKEDDDLKSLKFVDDGKNKNKKNRKKTEKKS
jgi:hypothetical protein